MNIPASNHFTPIPLSDVYNADRRQLPDPLCPPLHVADSFGDQAFHGIPFVSLARPLWAHRSSPGSVTTSKLDCHKKWSRSASFTSISVPASRPMSAGLVAASSVRAPT